MVAETSVALVPVLGLAVNALAHVTCIRLVGQRWAHLTLLAGFVAGGVACLAGAWQAFGVDGLAPLDAWARGCLSLMTYAALGYGYFAFANLTITSLRIRLLQDIDDAGGPVPVERLLEAYNAEAVLTARLERLVAARQIRESNDRYVPDKPTLLWLARVLDGLRLVVFGRRLER